METRKTMDKISKIIRSRPENFGSLGRELKISPKAKVNINAPDSSIQIMGPSVDILIGIGTDHVAHLIMTTEAWEAFKAGEKLDITSLKDFKEKFL